MARAPEIPERWAAEIALLPLEVEDTLRFGSALGRRGCPDGYEITYGDADGF